MFVATPCYRAASGPTEQTANRIVSQFGGVWAREVGCPWVGNARSELAGAFLESAEALLLWLDADNSFGPDVVWSMLRAEAPIVTCTYRSRVEPHDFRVMAYEDATVRRLSSGERLIEIEDDGLGCCLVRREVIATLAAKHEASLGYINDAGRPRVHLFAHGVTTVQGVRRAEGEDGAFFRRCREAGFTIECLADATIWHDGISGRLSSELDSVRSSTK